mgnify:CR=1 FL=1
MTNSVLGVVVPSAFSNEKLNGLLEDTLLEATAIMADAVANTEDITLKQSVYVAYVALLRRHYIGDFCEGFFWDSCDMNPDWLL